MLRGSGTGYSFEVEKRALTDDNRDMRMKAARTSKPLAYLIAAVLLLALVPTVGEASVGVDQCCPPDDACCPDPDTTASNSSEDEDADDSRIDDELTAVITPLPNPELPPNIQVVLDVLSGPEKGRKVKVERRSTVIGRGEDVDFQISDQTIGRKHCQLEIHNKDKMTIKDLASKNGTRLNDQYISAVKIRHGDVVRIGDSRIKILINIRR